MYTLRIIEQKQGLEKRMNFFLGKNYTVYSRAPLELDRKVDFGDLFAEALKGFIGEEEFKITLDINDVVGFVADDRNAVTLFSSDQVVYIVNVEGKTLERVYGMYNKQ